MRKRVCEVKVGTFYWLQLRKKAAKCCQISRGMTETSGIPSQGTEKHLEKISLGAKELFLMAGSSALGKEKPAR